MLPELGREPTPEELADRLAMPLDQVHRVLAIANRPIIWRRRLETLTIPLPAEPQCGHATSVLATCWPSANIVRRQACPYRNSRS